MNSARWARSSSTMTTGPLTVALIALPHTALRCRRGGRCARIMIRNGQVFCFGALIMCSTHGAINLAIPMMGGPIRSTSTTKKVLMIIVRRCCSLIFFPPQQRLGQCRHTLVWKATILTDRAFVLTCGVAHLLHVHSCMAE